MSITATLSDRMKEYESQTQIKLIKKLPVIIRIDGRGFSKFTKGFEKPFDIELSKIFQKVTLELCKSIDNIKFAYSQSDEISLLLTDWDHTKEADGGRVDTWYDYRVQKMVSVIGSQVTALFNQELYKKAKVYEKLSKKSSDLKLGTDSVTNELFVYVDTWTPARYKLFERKQFKAMFDARVFNLPVDEVCNYFIYRQQDALRNSVSGFARQYYSTKQLQGVKNPDKIQMVKDNYNVDFDKDISQLQKVGFAVTSNAEKLKDKYEVDIDIPLFKEDREYIEKYL